MAGDGGAAEARIYWDAGSGAVDFGTPAGTVTMGGPVAAARYTWTSGVLTAGATYGFVVRIATSGGLEMQNAGVFRSAVAPEVAVPDTPILEAQVV